VSRLVPVTDPNLLQQLNAPALSPVTDPALLQQLNGAAPAPQAPPPVPGATPQLPPEPQVDKSFGQGFKVGTQGVGRGLADVAGAPVDLTAGGINAVAGGINSVVSPVVETVVNAGSNKLFGVNPQLDIPDVPGVRNPLLGSDNIADMASQLSELIGYDVLDPETEMDASQRLGYNVNRFGAQGIVGAAGLTKAAANKTATEVPAIVRPYLDNPGKTAAGDTAAGVGTGAALHAYDENAPEGMKDSAWGRAIAALTGGIAGSGVPSAVMSPVRTVEAIADRVLPAGRETMDPVTGVRPTRQTENKAAAFLQSKASNKDTAAAEISDAIRFAREAGGTMPTTGMATGDTGIQYVEKTAALRDAPTFADRYRDVARDASNDLSRLEVDGDQTIPKQIAEQRIAQRRGGAQAAVEQGEKGFEAAGLDEKALADTYAPFIGGADQASMDLDKAIVDDTLRPMTGEKNRRFNEIDPNAEEMVGVEELVAALDAIDANAANLPPSLQSGAKPSALMDDLRKATEEGTVPFRTLTDMHPALSSEQAKARVSGDFQKADAIGSIKKATGKAAETLAAEGSEAGVRAKDAIDYYKGPYAPFTRGEGGKLREDINADDLSRTNTPPTKTASRFLKEGPGSREAAADLQEIMATTPDPKQAKESARRYVMDNLSKTVIDPTTGKVSETRLQKWINNRQGMLSQSPEIKTEVDNLLKEVRAKSGKTSTMRGELETARKNLKATDDEINASALSFYVGNNPENAVKEILNSGDPVKAVKEIRSTFGGDKAADAGFRSAFADNLVKSVTNADGEAVSFAKLGQTLKKHEAALKEVFGDDIQYVKQAQKRLEMLSRKNVQGAAGSDTIEKGGLRGLGEAFRKPYEIVSRMLYGALTGGSMTRKFNLMAEQLPDSSTAANELVRRAVLDPRVAKHLLGVSVKEVGTPRWNARLNRLMGWAEAGRESTDEDKR
jgi:hypothetical protein